MKLFHPFYVSRSRVTKEHVSFPVSALCLEGSSYTVQVNCGLNQTQVVSFHSEQLILVNQVRRLNFVLNVYLMKVYNINI